VRNTAVGTFLVLAAALLSLPATQAAAQARFATIYNFTEGAPIGLVAANGNLYGAFAGVAPTGSDCGDIFELDPPPGGGGAWTQTALYSFAGTYADGCDPGVAPIAGARGVLFGTTLSRGTNGFGTFYDLRPPSAPAGPWMEATLYRFGANVGPAISRPVPGPQGSFYLLSADGAYGYGALSQLQPPAAQGGTWTGTVLYSFPPGAPPDSLIMGPNGVFYGTTLYIVPGPPAGVIFQLTPPAAPGGTWTETEIYRLGPGDGSSPNSLTLGSDGILYGTTYGSNEATSGRGVVFQLTPPSSTGGNWTYTVLIDFQGAHLNSPLLLHNGKLYGTLATPVGGWVFELEPPPTPGGSWTTIYLHHFTNSQTPGGTLVLDKDGILYGATGGRGPSASGTIYRVLTE